MVDGVCECRHIICLIKQGIVKPYVAAKLVIHILLVTEHRPYQLAGIMDDKGVTLSAISSIKSVCHHVVPITDTTDVEIPLSTDLVGGFDSQVGITRFVLDGGCSLPTNCEHVLVRCYAEVCRTDITLLVSL